MPKIDEYITKYERQLKTRTKVESIDSQLLRAVTKACGPSIYKKGSSIVSSSNKREIARVKNSFLIKKLGLNDGKYLDVGIQEVVNQLGTENRNKYRAVFYYLLVQHFNASKVFIEDAEPTIKRLSSFGEKFINQQEDIDPEIRLATASNFNELLA